MRFFFPWFKRVFAMVKHFTIMTAVLFSLACTSTKATKLTESEIPPAVVIKAFEKQFPNAQEAEWEKEEEGYEVEFYQDGKELEIVYSEKGKMIEMEEEIEYKDIPQSLVEALASTYPGMEITQPERITRGNQTLYELTLVKDNISMESVFDEDGNLIEEEDD
jgi:hypothetical protein